MKKPKFNTSEIIKPSTITTNQDHRILHVLHQILTQSTPNSQQIKPINPVNKPTRLNPDQETNHNKPRSTQSNPNQHNQTQIPPPMTDTIKPPTPCRSKTFLHNMNFSSKTHKNSRTWPPLPPKKSPNPRQDGGRDQRAPLWLRSGRRLIASFKSSTAKSTSFSLLHRALAAIAIFNSTRLKNASPWSFPVNDFAQRGDRAVSSESSAEVLNSWRLRAKPLSMWVAVSFGSSSIAFSSFEPHFFFSFLVLGFVCLIFWSEKELWKGVCGF